METIMKITDQQIFLFILGLLPWILAAIAPINKNSAVFVSIISMIYMVAFIVNLYSNHELYVKLGLFTAPVFGVFAGMFIWMLSTNKVINKSTG